jgi:hypothetical protein
MTMSRIFSEDEGRLDARRQCHPVSPRTRRETGRQRALPNAQVVQRAQDTERLQQPDYDDDDDHDIDIVLIFESIGT